MWFDYGVDVISNGPNCGVALTFKTNVIEFISWRGQVTAVDGPAMGETSTDIGVTETRFTPLYYSLQKQGFGLSDTSFVWGGPYINSYSNINYGQLMSGDSDDNGIPDNWQNFYFPPPTTVDPNDDQDGDEYSNIEEFRADTNPLMSNQYPQVVEFVVSQGTSTVSFYSSKDRSYLFEVSTNLADGSWTNMQPAFMGIKTGEYFTISYPEVLKRGNFRYSVTMPGTE